MPRVIHVPLMNISITSTCEHEY